MKIAIISDIHDDYISLLPAARLIEQKKCDEIVCLGDIVGYSIPFYDYLDTRDASNCVQWVKANCKYVVAGNHDLFAARKAPVSKVRDFKYPENWYSFSYSERKEISENALWLYEDNELSALLNDEDIHYLYHLPESVIVEIEGKNCFFSHFIYPDLSGSAKEFLYAYRDIVDHLTHLKENNCNLSFSGHMHFEGINKLSDKKIVKIGFGKKTTLNSFDWSSVPSISNSKNANGFIIWDTRLNLIETISLKKKFKLL
jgi:predicted phosphodiesterase